LLVYPEPHSALLGEALVHVRGEFGGVGLSVQVIITAPEQQDYRPSLVADTYGALVFEEQPGVLILRAYHPESREPITQRLRTNDGSVTPHVAAIRAVETLRAALQQYYYTTNASMPAPIRKIARLDQQKAPEARAPPPERPPTPPARPPPPPDEPDEPDEPGEPGIEATLWLAPAMAIDVANRELAGVVEGAVSVGQNWYFGRLALDTSVLPFRIEAVSGSAELRRHAASLHFQGRLALGRDAALFGHAGAGAAYYLVAGSAEPGYVSQDAEHWTAFGAAGGGAHYRFGAYFGIYLHAQASLALDAPFVLFAGAPTERFERPSFQVALGATLDVMH
jgi:hypothetical protein